MADKPPISDSPYSAIAAIIEQARGQVKRVVNHQMVQACWHIGRLIGEQEQQGQKRAEYGKQQLRQISSRLQREFGRGFDVTNLHGLRQFYPSFQKCDALRPELNWTHYRTLIHLKNSVAREWYIAESANQYWIARALEAPNRHALRVKFS